MSEGMVLDLRRERKMWRRQISSRGVSVPHRLGKAAGSRSGPEMSTRLIRLSVRNEAGHIGLYTCLRDSSREVIV